MISNDEDIKKKKRRSKNTVANDKFICGCGKNYLSYAALFTHLKNSHDKIIPNGTIIPSKKKEGLRGRPKVIIFKLKINFIINKVV